MVKSVPPNPATAVEQLAFTQTLPPVMWRFTFELALKAGVVPPAHVGERAMIAYWLLNGSAPATPRARTGLNAASAGTRVVFTCRTMITSTCRTGLSPTNAPDVGGALTCTVVLFTPSVKPFFLASVFASLIACAVVPFW